MVHVSPTAIITVSSLLSTLGVGVVEFPLDVGEGVFPLDVCGAGVLPLDVGEGVFPLDV